MPYRLLADLVVVLHLAFVGFALFGSLLAFKWTRIVWLVPTRGKSHAALPTGLCSSPRFIITPFAARILRPVQRDRVKKDRTHRVLDPHVTISPLARPLISD